MLLTTFCFVFAYSQTFVTVNTKNGSNTYIKKCIDKISHDNEKVSIQIGGESYEYNSADIESLQFSYGEPLFLELPTKAIGDWDRGFLGESGYYMLQKYDNSGILVCCYIGNLNDNTESIIIKFDADYRPVSFFTDKEFVDINYDEFGNCLAFASNSSGDLTYYDGPIEITNSSSKKTNVKKANEATLVDISDAVHGLNNVLGIISKLNTVQHFISGNWDRAFETLFVDLAGTTLSMAVGNPVPAVIISLAYDSLDNERQRRKDEMVKIAFGNAQIEIKELKRTSFKTCEVSVKVSNLASMPYRMSSTKQKFDVKMGLYIRNGYSTVNHKYHSESTDFIEVTEDNTYTFTLDSREVGDTYYFAPALVPYIKCTHYYKGREFIDHDKIKYGSTQKLTFSTPTAKIVKINNISASSVDIVCDFENMYPEVSCGVDVLDPMNYDKKASASGSSINGEQILRVSSLQQETNYEASAYVSFDSKKFGGGLVPFKTIKDDPNHPYDMTGTWTVKQRLHFENEPYRVEYQYFTIELFVDGTAKINWNYDCYDAFWSGNSKSLGIHCKYHQDIFERGFVWSCSANSSENGQKFSGYFHAWWYNDLADPSSWTYGYHEGYSLQFELYR